MILRECMGCRKCPCDNTRSAQMQIDRFGVLLCNRDREKDCKNCTDYPCVTIKPAKGKRKKRAYKKFCKKPAIKDYFDRVTWNVLSEAPICRMMEEISKAMLYGGGSYKVDKNGMYRKINSHRLVGDIKAIKELHEQLLKGEISNET